MAAKAARHTLNPVIMMGLVLLATALLTYITPAGSFQRHGDLVVPGSYHSLPKQSDASVLLAPAPAASKAATTSKADKSARPAKLPIRAASLASILVSIPEGLVKSAGLIFMVLFVGGMFGVLRRTGAIDVAATRLVHATGGSKYVLVPILMIVLAAGSTFLGFISEYLVLIPIAALIGERMGFKPIFAMATVGVAAKIGYATSVTNPLALIIAQPLAHVPIFSGLFFRLALFVIFLAISIAYSIVMLGRPSAETANAAASHASERLSARQLAVLLALLPAGAVLICGSALWGWREDEISAYYVALSLLLALLGGLRAGDAADAFVDGMKSMILAGLLIGIAGAVQVLLVDSKVLDTLIYQATRFVGGQARAVVANELMVIEMALGVLIPSTSGKVAVSMPILAPIAQLSGVGGQTTVLAFVLGNGLTNMITPTSGMLLAYLAAARVSFLEWIGFVVPLFLGLTLLSVLALTVAVTIGY